MATSPGPETPLPEPARPLPEPATPLPEPATPLPEPARPLPEPATPLPQPARPLPEPARPLPEPARPLPEPAKPLPESATPPLESETPPALPPPPPPPPSSVSFSELDLDEFELHPEPVLRDHEPEHKVLRQYYEDNDFLLATEGILKVLSVVACLVVAGLYLGSGACREARGLVAGGTSVAFAAAGGVALLYAGAALQLPILAPHAWFYADIIVSTVMGILLLVTAVLSLVFCDLDTAAAYLLAPLGAASAALVVASVGITYGEVTRRWDASRPAVEPPRPTVTEQDV